MNKKSQSTVADPGFPRRGGALSRGGRQHTIFSNFPQNCIKLKEFGPPVGMRDACPIDPSPIKTFLHRIIPQTIPLERPILCKSKMEQECISVGCVLPARYCMGVSLIETPPPTETPRDPPDREPPWTEIPRTKIPRQRYPWTETPLSKDKQL